MAIASSTSSRRQCSSHGAGQTRPRTDGNGIVRLKMRVDFAPVRLGVRLEEARDVDVARALVLAGRQAVGVVVAEDQLEVRRGAERRTCSVWVLTFMPASHAREQRDRRVLLALDLDDAHPARAEARQLGLVAERRDLDAVVAADLEDRLALEALDDPAVDLDPDARRRLRPLRRLGRDESFGERVVPRCRRVDDGLMPGASAVGRSGRSSGRLGPQRVPAAAATAIGWQTPAGQELRRM